MRSDGAILASSWPFSTRSTSEPVTRLACSRSCDFFAPFLLCEMWFIWTITYGPEVARAATPPPLQPTNHTWKSRCFGSSGDQVIQLPNSRSHNHLRLRPRMVFADHCVFAGLV